MRLGFDFDNTIVSYDRLFHKVSVEAGKIPEKTPKNKNAVRDCFREMGEEDQWTEIQGYVYGARILEASLFPNALNVILELRDAGHELFIVSHKTRHPFIGPQFDLHEAAWNWIDRYLRDDEGEPAIPKSRVFFHEKKDEKIGRIRAAKINAFLDDLPEILLHRDFPPDVQKILFAPNVNGATNPALSCIRNWDELIGVLSQNRNG